MTSETYTVRGMTCSHCAAAVTEEVSKIPGVTGVEVDVAQGRVTVDSTEILERDQLSAAVDEAGYELADA